MLKYLIVLLLAASPLRALEIPLSRGASGQDFRVAVVDMEKVFREFPETQKARAEYYKELAKRREELASRERELVDLRDQLSVLQSTMGEMKTSEFDAPLPEAAKPAAEEGAPVDPYAAGVSSTSVNAVKERIGDQERLLKDQEAAIEPARRQAVRAVKQLEEQRSMQIMGKLYEALVQLAEEEGISLVLDRSTVVFGADTLDLTDRLSRRVRGIPEPEPE